MPVPGRRTVRRRTRPLIPAFLLLTGLLAAVVAVVPDRVARASAHATGVHLVALVANSNSNTVTPINLATDTPGSPIRVGSHPDAIAVTDGNTAYVANWGSNSVTPINLATKTPDAAIHICGGPNAIAITPDGTAAYVACYSATTPINLLTDKAGKAIHQGGYAIAISPDGAVVLIANQTNTALGGSLVGVDVATGKTIAAWGLAGSPDALAVAPDFSRVYVVLYGGGMYSIRWSATLHSRFFETGGTNPDAIGVTGNGRTAYVANSYTNTVVPILLSTGKRGRAIPVGDGPSAIAIAAHRWTHPATQPQALTVQSPALAVFKGKLYAAWNGQTGDRIWYSAYNGSSWSGQQTVGWAGGHALTGKAPALAVLDGHLYAAWTGATGDKIWYSSYNGTRWSVQHTVTGSWGSALNSTGPALAVLFGKLYAGWTETSTSRIAFSTLSGTTWTPPRVLSVTSLYTPALLGDPADGSLILAWTTKAGRVDWFSCCAEAPRVVPHAVTTSAPALASLGSTSENFTFYLAWMANGLVDYRACFPNRCWTASKFVPEALTDDAPALAVENYTVVAAWMRQPGNKVWYSTSNDPY